MSDNTELAIYGLTLDDPRGNLPVFQAYTFEAHVTAWNEVYDQIQDRLWALAAIAASIDSHYGSHAIEEFAKAVGYSPRRIWELAETYYAWEYCDRSHNVPFAHHTQAAREEDPEEAIELATDEYGNAKSLRRYKEDLGKYREQKALSLQRSAEGMKSPVVEVVEEPRFCPSCGTAETNWYCDPYDDEF